MAGVHPVFHVSQLKKSEKAVEAKQVPIELLDLQDTLEYVSIPRRSWIERSKRQEEQPFPSVKCCGVTIQSEKQLGRKKMISERSILTCSRRRLGSKS
jgi:predicted transcriptional regulator